MIRHLASPRLRAIGGSLGSSLSIQLFLLISGVLAARLLGPTDRGHLALIWTVALVITQLGSLGVPLAVTYDVARGDATLRSLVRDIGWPVANLILVVTGVHAVALAVLTSVSTVPSTPALLSLAVTPAILIQLFALAAVQGRERFHLLNFLRTLPGVLYALDLVVLWATDRATLTTVTAGWVAAYLLAALASAVAANRLARAEEARPEADAPASFGAMRKFGLRALFGWASPAETFRIDQLAVGIALSAHSLGIYVAALAFTNLPRLFVQGLGLLAYPATAAAPAERVKRVVFRFTLLGSVISLATCGVLAAVADPMVRVAFGSAFSSAVGPLRILLVATALLSVRRILSECLRGAGMPGAGSRAEALSWVVLIPGVILLAGPYGLNGVAFALVGTYAVSLLALLFTAVRAFGDKPRRARKRMVIRHPSLPSVASLAGAIAIACGAGIVTAIAGNGDFLQPCLVAAIAAVLAAPIVGRIARRDLDPFDPAVWFAAVWALQFVLRPISMLVTGDETLRGRYDVSDGVTPALLLGLVGAIAFQIAYAIARRRAATVPASAGPRRDQHGITPPHFLIVAFTCGLALLGMVLLAGSSAVSASTSSGAYVYLLPLTATPAILMLLLRYRAGSRVSLYGALLLLAISIVFSLAYGQRAFVLLPVTAAAIFWYLGRGRRPAWRNIVLAIVALGLPLFTVLEIAREQETVNPIAVLSSPELRPGPAVGRFVAGDTTSMFLALALQMRTHGTTWDFHPGLEAATIFTRPIPSALWPNKPLSSSEELYATYFPEHYSINKAGTLFTLVSEFYYDSGVIGVALGMLIVGYVYGLMWRRVRRSAHDPWVWALFAPAFLLSTIAFRGDLSLTFGLSIYVVGPLVAANFMTRLAPAPRRRYGALSTPIIATVGRQSTRATMQ